MNQKFSALSYLSSDLSCFTTSVSSNNNDCVKCKSLTSHELWHRRLGHTSTHNLAHLASTSAIPVKVLKDFPLCVASQFGKSHKLPFVQTLFCPGPYKP